MQAVGMVNDNTVDCLRWQEIEQQGRQMDKQAGNETAFAVSCFVIST
jgi:hypothetical protein